MTGFFTSTTQNGHVLGRKIITWNSSPVMQQDPTQKRPTILSVLWWANRYMMINERGKKTTNYRKVSHAPSQKDSRFTDEFPIRRWAVMIFASHAATCMMSLDDFKPGCALSISHTIFPFGHINCAWFITHPSKPNWLFTSPENDHVEGS